MPPEGSPEDWGDVLATPAQARAATWRKVTRALLTLVGASFLLSFSICAIGFSSSMDYGPLLVGGFFLVLGTFILLLAIAAALTERLLAMGKVRSGAGTFALIAALLIALLWFLPMLVRMGSGY